MVCVLLGHRSRGLMRSLTSSLKNVINVFLNGQLVALSSDNNSAYNISYQNAYLV